MLGWTLFLSTVLLLVTPAVFGAQSPAVFNGISLEGVVTLAVIAYGAHVVFNMARKLKDNGLCG